MGDGGDNNGYIIMQQQDSMRFQVFGGDGVSQGDYGLVLTNADQENWIHVAITNQSGTMSIYKNGLLVVTGSSPNTVTASTYDLGIGHDEFGWFKSYWNGKIDDIRIYNRVLNESEINSLYHEGGWNVTSVSEENVILPAQYQLQPNYPNPFNPSTTIQYGLPSRSTVRLVIYNVLGQVVKELINTEQRAGIQSAVWNANVASGLYFYRIEAISLDNPNNRFVETKKMLLLK